MYSSKQLPPNPIDGRSISTQVQRWISCRVPSVDLGFACVNHNDVHKGDFIHNNGTCCCTYYRCQCFHVGYYSIMLDSFFGLGETCHSQLQSAEFCDSFFCIFGHLSREGMSSTTEAQLFHRYLRQPHFSKWVQRLGRCHGTPQGEIRLAIIAVIDHGLSVARQPKKDLICTYSGTRREKT